MLQSQRINMEAINTTFHWLTTLLRSAELLPDFSSARGVFCSIAWVATLLSLGMMAMAIFADFGSDADGDIGGEAVDGDTGHFSLRAAVGFLLGFGWGGYVAVQSGLGVGGGIIVGLALGMLLFFVVAGIMRFIYSLKTDGSLNYATLVGMTGTVYVTIPPHGEPGGQVQVSHPSQLVTMAAVQHGDTPLPAQTRIIVEAASTFQLTVRALNSDK